MNTYLDCEFNGFGGELLSIALVADFGPRYFYMELQPSETPCEWVAKNVLPLLTDPKRHREEVQYTLQAWLHMCAQYGPLTIIADWPDDIRYFCELLIVGPGKAILTPDALTFAVDRRLNSSGSATPHHALHDAIAIQDTHRRLMAATPAEQEGKP